MRPASRTFAPSPITLARVNSHDRTDSAISPPFVALLGWLVPGLGYWLIGMKHRAFYAGITIFLVFAMGLLISGVRCVDVPGYDADGNLITLGSSTSPALIRKAPFRAVFDKPWYIPQIMAGPLTIASSVWSVNAAATYPKATARLFDIGTLYTAIAGMLNLLVIIDAAHRAAQLNDRMHRPRPI